MLGNTVTQLGSSGHREEMQAVLLCLPCDLGMRGWLTGADKDNKGCTQPKEERS